MIVIDASAAIEALLGGPRSEPIITRLLRDDEPLHAPHLIDAEVVHVLRRFVQSGAVGRERGEQALSTFSDMPILRHAHTPLLPRVWALRENLTAYDALYVALAESLGATLLTKDRRLANAAGVRARVEVFPTFDA